VIATGRFCCAARNFISPILSGRSCRKSPPQGSADSADGPAAASSAVLSVNRGSTGSATDSVPSSHGCWRFIFQSWLGWSACGIRVQPQHNDIQSTKTALRVRNSILDSLDRTEAVQPRSAPADPRGHAATVEDALRAVAANELT
jgi:hypothetical protein